METGLVMVSVLDLIPVVKRLVVLGRHTLVVLLSKRQYTVPSDYGAPFH